MDRQSWADFVRSTSSVLYGMLRGRGFGTHDAMDIGQEAYRRVIEHYGEENDTDWLRSRLLLTADRLCIAHWRRTARQAASLVGLPTPETRRPGPAQEAERRELDQALRWALQELGEPTRSVLLERFQQPRRSDAELAESFDLSVANVRQLRRRGLLRLAELLRRWRDEGQTP